MGSIPGSGRYPGEGNGNPLQNPCLEMPWTEEPGGLQSVGVTEESDTTWQLNNNSRAASHLSCEYAWLTCWET